MHKRFGGVHALRGVELTVRRGEVHGLVGANGSGKSTLLNILSGQIEPDAGSIHLDGVPLRLGSPARALAAGIATVTQETTLVPELSVAENILLGPRKVRRWSGIDWRATHRRAAEVLARLGVDFSVGDVVSRLRPDQQQMVEIARAISMDARILLLDEATSSLTDDYVEALFELVRSLKQHGLTTIFVSHRMSELFALADRITIVRDGRTVEAGPIEDYDADKVVQGMVGRPPAPLASSAPLFDRGGTPVLRARDIRSATGSSSARVRGVDVTVGEGEIVGLAGVAGCGRTELLDAIFGLVPRAAGTVEIDGAPVRSRRVSETIAQGLAYVPGDRKNQGLVLNMTLTENMMMAQTSGRARLRVSRRARERSYVRSTMDDFGIVAGSANSSCATLSGGNQQKVVLAKWLSTDPRVILMDEPTRGVDVGAKQAIYGLLARARERGVAILVSSSETEELMLICDRILVMFRGQVVAELDRASASEAELARYSMGHT
ncbi:MAG: sugar ABC transporter ATP-binding protein [Solirubrobacteraceae bacterium]|nr:sugar ABC transporter ATP-binding protein [Solirubrobacteraceae bacterium]